MNIFGHNLSNYVIEGLILLVVGALISLVYMLFRILNEQENIFKEIRNSIKNLTDAGEQLNSMYSLSERLLERIKDARTSIPFQSPNEVDLISNDMMTKNIRKIESIASEMKALIDTMKSQSPDDLKRWLNNTSQGISQLLADQKNLGSDIFKLQKILDQNDFEGGLKRTSYANLDDSNAYTELQQKIENYQTMIMKSREKSRDAANRIAELESEVALLKSKNENTGSETNDMLEQLQNEMKKVALEKSSLTLKLESLADEIKRTKIEKNFIEDKFIELT